MRLHRECFLKYLLHLVAVLPLAVTLAVPGFAQTSTPTVVSSRGYINGTPLAAHTSAAFNSTGASTLVAFVSSHPSWNGLPVSISGLTDSQGNTWSVMTGPTSWAGNTFTLLSAIYYVNAPITAANHTVTVNLTNPAPLVVHVFAVSGSDVTGPPIYSPITDPGVGLTSTDVTSAPITVPDDVLLLAWTKNELDATATALDGYTLDAAQSTAFLWAESQTVLTGGSYTGHFQYDAAIGWQTAVVGLKPLAGPVALNQTVTTFQDTPMSITLTASNNGLALSYIVLTGPSHGALSGVAPNLTYTPATGYTGPDGFTFKANDGVADSNVATVSISVRGPNHAPVASDGNGTVLAGSTAALTLVASDADQDPLIYIIVNPPAHGQLSSGTGAIRTYTPNAGYVGGDAFTFKVNDGTTDSNTATVSITVTTVAPGPTVLTGSGYINSSPLMTHTSPPFNSTGASTLVAFVSSHPAWNGNPVSISSLSDNQGNTWKLLTGPTTWVGTSFTLLSSIYYVNAPATGTAHTVSANLTNPAPLVLDVFAVVGTDISGPPIFSPITDPGVGQVSADVRTAPIDVPADTLLLAWVKNETTANATALDGYSMDTVQSTPFLWAESQTAFTAASYSGHFMYDTATGWQTAIVGLQPPTAVNHAPVASNGSLTTNENVTASGTLIASDADSNPLTFTIVTNGTNGTASITNPATGAYTYTPNANASGVDSFTFKANDGLADSNVATVTVTIVADTTAPPAPAINSTPTNPTNQTSATFSFTDTEEGVSFLCQLDGGTFSACTSPVIYPGPLTSGSHTFSVKAKDSAGNQSDATSFSWNIVLTPSVSGVSPNNGLTTGGTGVTITGTNFAAGAGVTFGGTAATNVVVVNSTSITATAPAHAAGAVTVTVTVNSQSGSLSNGFTYTVPVAVGFAQVAAATPQVPTQVVTVTYPAGQTAHDLNVVVVGWNDTTATVQTVKDSAGNTYSLAIGPTSGTGLRQSIYYAANIVGGSNTVTVTFSQAAVYPDIRILEYRGISTVDVTAGASGSSATASSGAATTTVANELIFGANTVATSSRVGSGFTSRIITSPDGDIAEDKVVTAIGSNSATSTLTSSGPWVMQMVTFSEVSSPAPSVTSVSPNTGPTAGGTSVTITGTNFASGATATFGGVPATNVTVVNSTTMTATTPAGIDGAATVTVSFNGQSGSLTNGFAYVAPLSIGSVSPNLGPTAGGTAVTITGAKFASGATVTFGGAPATNVNVLNSSTITASTPPGAAGAVTVTVTVNSQSVSLVNGFTYTTAPIVSGVSPNNGLTTGGTGVTITGTNFVAGAGVTFGGTAATNVVVVNSTSITATAPAHAAGAVTVTVTVNSQSGSLSNGFTYNTPVAPQFCPGSGSDSTSPDAGGDGDLSGSADGAQLERGGSRVE